MKEMCDRIREQIMDDFGLFSVDDTIQQRRSKEMTLKLLSINLNRSSGQNYFKDKIGKFYQLIMQHNMLIKE